MGKPKLTVGRASGATFAVSTRWVDELPPTLHLGVGAVPDLPPDRIWGVRVGKALSHDTLQVQPLDSRE